MLRGEIRLVEFARGAAGEPDRRRPAVIVSNDGMNTTTARLGRGAITVVPVTSNVTQLYAFQVLLPASETGLDVDSKAKAEEVTTVNIERVKDRLGRVPLPTLLELDDALRLHLAL